MAEIRFDPIGRYSVVIAPERSKRPQDNITNKEKKSELCPFCPGNENQTPPETYSNGNNVKKWTIRSIPNKYPAFSLLNNPQNSGVQEVIVETDRHDINMGDFTYDHMVELLKTYQHRLKEIKKNKDIKYIVVFKNHGLMAGATLTHQHSQIVGLSFVPAEVELKLRNINNFAIENGKCFFCKIDREDVVYENNSFKLISPKTARFAYECWIIPSHHQSHFEDISVEQIGDLAEIFLKHIKVINSQLNNPSFNVILNNGLYNQTQNEIYHWYIQVIPRTSLQAGFEWATGMFINQVEPEKVMHLFKNKLYNY